MRAAAWRRNHRVSIASQLVDPRLVGFSHWFMNNIGIPDKKYGSSASNTTNDADKQELTNRETKNTVVGLGSVLHKTHLMSRVLANKLANRQRVKSSSDPEWGKNYEG
ncbi:hypothetical protein MY1884_008967, partial [Beauveria asiatica]